MAEGNRERLRRTVEKEFGGEAVADGSKEGGVGERTKRARDIGSEVCIAWVSDGRDSEVDREG